MEIAEITETLRPAASEPTGATDFTHCDQCGAPVEHLQRYCVECGAHRAGVPDPAARYLARVGRGARLQSRPAGTRRRRRRRVSGLVVALALAIPAAGGIGVAIGESSDGGGAPAAHPGASATSGAGSGTAGAGSTGVDNATGSSYLKKSLSGPAEVKVP